MSTDLTAAALAAAARGWCVFPLQVGGKRPALHSNWEGRATTDTDRIQRCWEHGPYNIGVATGASGLVVVDLDTPKDGDTPPPEWALPGIVDGADVLATVAERHGQPLPLETFTVRTASGGMHLYFTAPPERTLRNTCRRLGWLVDTRAAGGYVAAAGSTVNGHAYEVVHDTDPAPLPGWLAALLTEPSPPPANLQGVLSTLRTDHRAGYANIALRNEVQRVLDARQGSRNHTLNHAAFALGQLTTAGFLTRQLAYDCLYAAGQHIGLPVRECEATIRSGLTAGETHPRGSAA